MTTALKLLLLFFSIALCAEEKLLIMTEEFPPYGYYDDGKLVGIGVDVVKAIMNQLNMEDSIHVYPWARAYNEIQTNENRVLFLMARTPERDSLFKWAGPIFRDSVFFYKRSDDMRELTSLDALKSVKNILVNRGFPQQKMLEKMEFPNLYLTVNPKQDIRMMRAGRADIMVIGSAALGELIREEGLSAEFLINTGVHLFSTDLYIAFSKDVDSAYVERWNNAIRDLKDQGDLQKIFERYIPDFER